MNQTNTRPPASNGGRKYRNDLIFIAVLLAVLLLIGAAVLLFRSEGDTVTVTVDGKLYATYSLSEDVTVEIRTGEQGNQVNRLVIRDHRAYVESATCPDGICAAHKPISRNGESIVCLPHRVVVAVKTSEQGSSEPDVAA